jgi:hypothetical protein
MSPSSAALAVDVSVVDRSLFTRVTEFARESKWLNGPVAWWTDAGLAVFGVLFGVLAWKAWRLDARERTLAVAVAAPVAVGVAFPVTQVVQRLVSGVQPCCSLPSDYYVHPVRLVVAALVLAIPVPWVTSRLLSHLLTSWIDQGLSGARVELGAGE